MSISNAQGTERVSLQPAYILHSRPYRDTSSILEVFTAEHGRLSLVAKGARRQSKKGSASANLQAFLPLLLSYAGRSELKTLVASEGAGAPFKLRAQRLFSGLYLNELLVRLLHRHDPHPTLFAAYGEALLHLAESAPLDGTLRSFELTLLDELGYRLRFDVDGFSSEPIQAKRRYRFDKDHGLVFHSESVVGSVIVYSGSDLLAMAAGTFDGDVSQPAKRLLREALAIHLGDAPLHSRALFRGSKVSSSQQSGGAR